MTDALPAGFTARAPRLDDAQAVANLISACRAVDTREADSTLGEVLDDWADVDLATEAVAVLAPDGGMAGYADILNRSYVVVSVYGYVHPTYRGRGIGGYLLEWGERWTRDRMERAPEGARVVVQHYVVAENADARGLLATAGYEPVRRIYEMEIDLPPDLPLSPPAWPAGVTVRGLVPGEDERACYEAVEDAFRDVWGRPRGAFERFVGMTEREGFDPALWLMAMDGEEIAGLVLGRVVEGMGWVDVVGVRRPWRGRGLGLALLRQLFEAYRTGGVRRVGLSVDAESLTGAPRLYARAGMRVVRSHILYQKELRPGVDLTTAANPA